MKILILKPSSLGDVILALPVLRQLKKHLPSSEIYWWLSGDLAPLLQNDPDLSGIILWQRKRWVKPRFWPEMLASIRQIRAHKFDYIIDLQGLARSAIFGWLGKGEHLIGLNDAREGARTFYDTILGGVARNIHAADWYQNVLTFFGIKPSNDFVWMPENPVYADAVQTKWDTSPKRWIILNPGARWLNKRWPAERFASLVSQLVAEGTPWKFAVLGGKEDQEMSRIITRAAPDRCLDLAGKTSLLEMVEWLRLGELMISNDTGPIHIAAALGTPIIGLYGPTNPGWTGPYGQIRNVLKSNLPCMPCDRSRCYNPIQMDCLRGIRAEDVVRKVLLRDSPAVHP